MEPLRHAAPAALESSAPIARRSLLAFLAGASACSLLAGCAVRQGRAAPGEARLAVDAFLARVRAGDAAEVERMLEQDARLARAVDGSGRSAFVLAHVWGRPEIAALLARRGLELDLVEAVLAADWERVEALAAADPEGLLRAHPIGGTPLYASALCGGEEQYRLRSLGCDPDGRPSGGSGFTPARAAMDCRDPLGAWLAAIDLLSNGADPNAPQARGDSVLHGAVRARDARLVRLVLRKGGDPRARDERERTPQALAAELGWSQGVELLAGEARVVRDHRASRLAFDQERRPFTLLALDDVPARRQSEVTGLSHFDHARVEALLAADPRLIHSLSSDAELAIEACGHTGRRDIIQLHLDHGAPLSLSTAISLGELDHARWLLQRDPRLIHERGPHDFALMWYPAIGGGSVEAAELLLAHGADLEQESGGETALHWAAWRGHPELIRYLVGRGADLQARSHRRERGGLTPLQMALSAGREQAAATLRELGARA